MVGSGLGSSGSAAMGERNTARAGASCGVFGGCRAAFADTDPSDFSCYRANNTGPDIIARLRVNEAALRARGVCHAAVFGSRARGDSGPDSDTDIMIEIDPEAPVGVHEYVGIKEYISSLIEGRVDVVDLEGLSVHSETFRIF